jgi:hypothetical protein
MCTSEMTGREMENDRGEWELLRERATQWTTPMTSYLGAVARQSVQTLPKPRVFCLSRVFGGGGFAEIGCELAIALA